MTTARIRVGTVNVPIKVGRKGWRTSVDRMLARCDVLTINESLSQRQRIVYRNAARRHGFKQSGLWATPNPVLIRKSVLERTAAKRHRLHGRLTGWWLFPGYRAARSATTVAAKHRKSGIPLAFTGFHQVPPGRKVEPRSRVIARDKSLAVLNRIAANQRRLHRVHFPAGDTNQGKGQPAINGIHWQTASVDKVGYIDAPGYSVEVVDVEKVPVISDHKHGIVATYRIEETR